MEVDRSADIKKIDHGIKNGWNWKWMKVKDHKKEGIKSWYLVKLKEYLHDDLLTFYPAITTP